MFHLRVIGMIDSAHLRSFDAFSADRKLAAAPGFLREPTGSPAEFPRYETVIREVRNRHGAGVSSRTAVDKVVVVQKRLAHAHEDEVDARQV